MITYCPRCGAEFPVEVLGELIRTSVRCPDCRLAPADAPAMLAPAEDESTELGYELEDWPVTDRGPVTAALVAADIPYRWEAGLVLVVPTDFEAQVDQIMDSVTAEEAGDGLDGDPAGDEGADGGEEAQAAMSDLYVAADRLQHAPFDAGMGSDLKVAAAAVAESLPPYGIDRAVWRQIQTMAATVVAGLDTGADDDQVGADTRALREFLRTYV